MLKTIPRATLCGFFVTVAAFAQPQLMEPGGSADVPDGLSASEWADSRDDGLSTDALATIRRKIAMFTQDKKLTAADAAAGDRFGRSVSISGDTAVVAGGGSVYVFERNLGGVDNWGQVKELTSGVGESVSISGDTLVTGNRFDEHAGPRSGAAYVFERNLGGADNWGQAKRLTVADAAANQDFGISVSISDDTVVIGAWGHDGAGSDTGSAYIFDRNEGGANNWGQRKQLTAADAAAFDFFGGAVSISGNTVVVGAVGDDDAGSSSGSAYMFERNLGGADNWGRAKRLTATDAAAGDSFGSSVSINGNTVVVGALLDDDDAGPDFGSAYVFERDEGGAENWGQKKKLTATDAAADDQFGWSVSISGNTVVVGVPLNDDAGFSSGSAYIFERDFGGAGNWGQAEKLTTADAAAGDLFGISVSIDGNTVVGGARDDDDAGTDSGSAYVLSFPTDTVDLAVSMTESIDPVVPGSGAGNLTYTVTVTNIGPADATGVVLSHDLTLPAGVSVDSHTPSGATTFTPTSAPDGDWTVGSLAAGASETLTVVLTVDALAAPGTDVVSSTATVTAVNETDSTSGNDSATATTSIASNAVDLAISMAESSDPVAPGSAVTHTVTVTNIGTAGATGVVLSHDLTLPAGVSVDSRTPSGSTTFTPTSAPDGNWTVGHLVAGANETLTVVLTVDAQAVPGTDVLSSTATVTAVNETDSFSGNDSATERTSIAAPTAALISQVKKLLSNDDAAAGDEFGSSVAISGDTAVVGAHLDDEVGLDSGSAYIFERHSGAAGSWGLVKKLTVVGGAGDRFGWSVAISGDTVVVGATHNSDIGPFSGAVYIFERNRDGADKWGQVRKLTPSAEESFGSSVAISGDTVVVGASGGLNAAGISSGVAYIFERNFGGADNWGQKQKIFANDGIWDARFGRHGVGISGDTVVVGATQDDDKGIRTGAAYIFERDFGGEDNWGQVKKLLAADGKAEDEFGRSVAISGDTVVVGVDDDLMLGADAAYVFERNFGGVGNWGQVKKLLAADAVVGDLFGTSVAISGNTVVVGAYLRDDGMGAAYVFERSSGGDWQQTKKLTADDANVDDHLGWSMGIDGNTVIVGAPLDDDKGGDAGAAYVFDLAADLTVSVTESLDPVVAGSGAGNLTYLVTVANYGPNDASGVVVAEDLTLPAGVEVVSVTPSGATTFTPTTAPDGLWTVGSLPAGTSATLTVVLTADASALAGADVIGHTATVTALNESDTVIGNNAATRTTSIRQEADLRVTNTDGLPSAVPGESSTYTIIAANAGPSYDPAVTLGDVFPADLECTYASVASGGASGNTSTATTGATHLDETLSFPAGSSVTYTVDCAIDSAATGTLSNTATISTSVIDPVPGNNLVADTTSLTPEADLSVSMTDGLTTATSGDTLTYTIDVSNMGPSDDPSATLTDTFPLELTCSYTSQPSGGLTGNTAGSGNLGETLSMPSGSAVRYTVQCEIDSTATGTLSNTATITASVTDPATGNNTSSDETTLVAVTLPETGRLLTFRDHHTATLLPSGKVLVAGGTDGTGSLASAELYDPSTGTWTATGSMNDPRQKHTATLLPSGKVLVAGGEDAGASLASAELYDPGQGSWQPVQDLAAARRNHTATLLPSGQLLVVGGEGSGGALSSAELYDPAAPAWTSANPSSQARWGHTATLLPSGKVLVAGGRSATSTSLSSAELYDWGTGAWSPAAALQEARTFHTATLLASGKILVAGGKSDDVAFLSSAELYQPDAGTGTWGLTGSLQQERASHTATLLASGKVLVAGGESSAFTAVSRVELYDPDPGLETWTSANPLGQARSFHTATLLASGEVLLAGGLGEAGALWSAELFNSSTATSTATGSLGQPRQEHTATLLTSGEVLVIGGDGGAGSLADAELYDPGTGTWTPPVGSLATARKNHTATLLSSGQVLVVGGEGGGASLPDAELYNPSSGTLVTASLGQARSGHTATLLPTGEVLVAGGRSSAGETLSSVEFYDPDAQTWTAAGSLAFPRENHTATLLLSGKVLVVGCDSSTSRWCAELYDPITRTSKVFDSLATPRENHTATLLPSGKVLVAGGTSLSFLKVDVLTTADIFDPLTETWTATSPMATARPGHTATLLPSGKVLVTGGLSGEETLTSAEVFDPLTETWTAIDPLAAPRSLHSATLLASGKVLVAGGEGVSSAELYDFAAMPSSRVPAVESVSPTFSYADTSLQVQGSFRGDSETSGGGTNASAANFPLLHLRRLDGSEHHWLRPDPQANFWDAPRTVTVSRLPNTIRPGTYLLSVVVAGVPSEGVPVEMVCSVGVDPVLQVEPAGALSVGETVTWTVDHNGGWLFRWQQCHGDQDTTCREDDPSTPGVNEDGPGWDLIEGATGAAYSRTITGPDAGTRLRVEVESSCGAEATTRAAVLSIDDQVRPGCADAACTALTDPPVAVVTPNGGELWPLSQENEVSLRDVSWTMTDDIRVCRVDVTLLSSGDGGQSYTGEIPLRSFGSTENCFNPGELTTSFRHTLPPEPPSGKVGSLYKVRIEVTDHAGNTTVDESDKPFFIVEPNNDSVQTLILWHRDRMAGDDTELDDVDEALRNLAVHPQVRGRVVDLGGLTSLGPLYDAWDAATTGTVAANDVLFAPDGLQEHLQDLVRVFTGVEYVVLVGGDDVIPFARLPDNTALLPEERYVLPHANGGYDLTADATTVGRAAAANFYLSDDPLVALVDPVRGPQDLLQRGIFFLPDLAVGRLVETPAEIVGAINNFQGRGGVVDLGERTHKVQVAGYDFLADSAYVVKEGWQSSLTLSPSGEQGGETLSGAELDATLIGQGFGRDDLLAGLCAGGDSYGLISLNGHATHYQEGVPGTSHFDIQGLESDLLEGSTACNGMPLDLGGALIYAVGCHGGLPVPDSAGAGENPLDLPQAFLRRGALVYIANTGYGWGLKKGTGYGERLIEIFSEQLRTRSLATVGHEVRAAKLRYYLESGQLDDYDLKTLMQWTYYGLPMVRLRTGIAKTMRQAAPQPFAGPAPSAAELPAFEDLGALQVSRQVSGHGAPIKAALPDFLTRLEQRFEFSDASYTKRSSTGEPLSVWGCPDVDGCYYTLNQVAERGTSDSDQPIEPFFVFDSRLSGTSQHGVLWLGGDYKEEDGWRPIFAELISSGVETGSNHGSTPIMKSIDPIDTPFPPRFTDGECRPSDLEINSLLVPTGETRHGPGTSGLSGPVDPADFTIHRLYESIDVEVFYYNNLDQPAANCDREGPLGLEPGGGPFGGLYHTTGGARVEWRVPVRDEAGVWRVVVVYDLEEAPLETGGGSWVPFELTPEGVDADGNTVFSGELGFSSGQSLTYTIQAVDNRGNVSFLPFQGPSSESTSSGVEPVDRDTVDVFLGGQADLAVKLTPGPDPLVGGDLRYLVNVTNLGGGLATDLVVEHRITAGGEATFLAAGGPSWICTATSEGVRCSRDELAELESSEVAVFYRAPSVAGTLEATVSVISAESDPVPGNNSADASTPVNCDSDSDSDSDSD